MKTLRIVNAIAELRSALAPERRAGKRIGLVPTMGALHEGHLSLVREAAAHASTIVVSIFVNPTQFAPHEDFKSYPRNMEADCAMLEGLADLVFAPSVAELYPDGFTTRLEVGGPSAGLETDFRPHFFSGVATVVSKLLIAAAPDFAIFGEKDYQQLLVIRRMATDLALPVEIAGGKIVREVDGLAMSSRNAYLALDQRFVAGRLNLILRDVATRFKHGDPVAIAEQYGRSALLEAGFNSVDYVAIRDAETLSPVAETRRPARVLAAATVGRTRLIDNMAV